MNTFISDALPDILKYHGERPIRTETVPVRSLKSILDQYLNGNSIDLLNIDAEGADEKILLSNDWNLFRPKVIIVEHHGDVHSLLESSKYALLYREGYVLGGYSRHSFIFHDKNYSGF